MYLSDLTGLRNAKSLVLDILSFSAIWEWDLVSQAYVYMTGIKLIQKASAWLVKPLTMCAFYQFSADACFICPTFEISSPPALLKWSVMPRDAEVYNQLLMIFLA